MHSKEIETYKKSLKLTKNQREILIGTLLGDAHLESQNHGRTYRLKIEQSIKHRTYVEHLYQIFKEWVSTPPRVRTRVGENNSRSEMTGFQTYSHGALRFYAHQFYQAGRKHVPKLIHRWLTPRAMAYWFMDDGSIKWRHSRAVIFNTQGYTREEVQNLADLIRGKFGLDAKLRRQKEGYQICILGHSLKQFVELVGPYLLPEMIYKLPLAGRTLLPKE